MRNKNNKIPDGAYYITGRNTCLETLASSLPRVLKVVCTQAFQKHESIKTHSGLKTELMDNQQLNNLLGTSSHQGVALLMQARKELSVTEFLTQQGDRSGFVLLVDSLEDPQNFGSILRVAECYGCKALVYSKNRNVEVTPAVSKVAVGASEIVPMIEVSNLVRAVKEFKKANWWVLASECSAESVSLNKFEYPRQSVIVIGSEGTGVSRLLLEESDFKVNIPMYGKIDSLNVAQATAVFAYEYARQLEAANSLKK